MSSTTHQTKEEEEEEEEVAVVCENNEEVEETFVKLYPTASNLFANILRQCEDDLEGLHRNLLSTGLRVGIIGKQTYGNEQKFGEYLHTFSETHQIKTLCISNRGALDALTQKYATERKVQVEVISPKGKEGTPLNLLVSNKMVIDCSEHLVVFWDGPDHMMKHSLTYLIKAKKPYSFFQIHEPPK